MPMSLIASGGQFASSLLRQSAQQVLFQVALKKSLFTDNPSGVDYGILRKRRRDHRKRACEMTASVPGGEGEQAQPQQPPQQKESVESSDPSVRDMIRVVAFIFAGLFVVMIAVMYVSGNSAAGIQDRARAESTIRIELGLLPPYPDSVLIDDPAINSWDKPVSVDDTYTMTPGACRSVQSYYTTVAPQHGWQVTRPLTAGSDQGTTLSTFFGKTAGGYTLQMIVECRDGDAYYDVGINS